MTDQPTADASATRAFFVDMIVRDIDVSGAMLDLIDNAVDAAQSQQADESLNGFHVEINFDEDHFLIEDNCGGIDLDTARHYAFRFGRASDYNPPSRIGQFGIGMKRAVFRLGNFFRVESATQEHRFEIEVDARAWREGSGAWEFPMAIQNNTGGTTGTRVEVRELHENVKVLLAQNQFQNSLLGEIADRYRDVVRNGFAISVNHKPAEMRILELLHGSGIAPEHKNYELESNGHSVRMRIIAGIGPRRQPATDSGWYIYCNGRLVIRADRTLLTGWGTAEPGGRGIPAWHDQYRRFRGYIFFESDHVSALPWTTTKTEIDKSSDVYIHALVHMRSLIRRYATFTNELGRERSQVEDLSGSDLVLPAQISDALARAALTKLDQIPRIVPAGSFTVPERVTHPRPTTPPRPNTTSIQFSVLSSEVNELKKALGLRSNREVGEAAFERLYEEEIG